MHHLRFRPDDQPPFDPDHSGLELIHSPGQAADVENHYKVRLLPVHLEVERWRRSADGCCWIPRYGPMTMAAYLQRFLPRDER